MALHPQDVLADHYVITEHLGGGSAGIHTFAAVDRHTNESVVIKEMVLRDIEGWKTYDLFEREAKVLAQLQHPRIPRVIEYFRIEDDKHLKIYLVMARVPGQSIAARLASGWRPTEQEVQQIAADTLHILSYLHSLKPPVIHRDIKPSNLVLDDDGHVHLVDFGGVAEVIRPEGGSTVVGTFGYMAPEQFAGAAVPQSDLYGLGATLVHLLAGIPPSEIPQRELRLDFSQKVHCSPDFCKWLDGLLEPGVEKRFPSTVQALGALQRLVGRSKTLSGRKSGPLATKIVPQDDLASTSNEFTISERIGLAIAGTIMGLSIGGIGLGSLGAMMGAVIGGGIAFWAPIVVVIILRIIFATFLAFFAASLGGALGLAFGGPILGGIFGFALGVVVLIVGYKESLQASKGHTETKPGIGRRVYQLAIAIVLGGMLMAVLISIPMHLHHDHHAVVSPATRGTPSTGTAGAVPRRRTIPPTSLNELNRQAALVRREKFQTHFQHGQALLSQNQYKEAIAEFREATRLDPKYADAHNYLGEALLSQKRYKEAIAEFREATRLDPNDADARENLKSVLRELDPAYIRERSRYQ